MTNEHRLHWIGRPECVAADCEPDLPHFAQVNPDARVHEPANYVPRRAAR